MGQIESRAEQSVWQIESRAEQNAGQISSDTPKHSLGQIESCQNSLASLKTAGPWEHVDCLHKSRKIFKRAMQDEKYFAAAYNSGVSKKQCDALMGILIPYIIENSYEQVYSIMEICSAVFSCEYMKILAENYDVYKSAIYDRKIHIGIMTHQAIALAGDENIVLIHKILTYIYDVAVDREISNNTTQFKCINIPIEGIDY